MEVPQNAIIGLEGLAVNQKRIGSYVALKRKQMNLTQEQLAETIGVSNKTVSKWETGKCMPDYATLPALCNALAITLAELLDGEDAEPNSIRLYDEEQRLELIVMMQTKTASSSLLEAAHSIMIGTALIMIAFALHALESALAGFVAGLSLVIVVFGIYSAVEEAKYAIKIKP